jgi:glutathione S-transferase
VPTVTLHVIAGSHPCRTVLEAARIKNLDHEVVTLAPGPHNADMESTYGAGRTTVPGMVVDGETVHGSVAILERMETIAPEPTLYPEPIADAVHEAERWGDGELQDLGRRFIWGPLRFRPEAAGTYGGGAPLDAAGVDFMLKFLHGAWAYHRITAVRLAEDLRGFPTLLDQADAYAAAGVLGDETPTAAGLQIGATLRLLLTVGDLRPLIDRRPSGLLARRFFPEYPGDIPAGAFPAGWVPAPGS